MDWQDPATRKAWKFSRLWHVLEEHGWKWTKGRELVSFFYIRPDCTATLPHTNGIDFFSSEEEVLHYVSSTVRKRRAQLANPVAVNHTTESNEANSNAKSVNAEAALAQPPPARTIKRGKKSPKASKNSKDSSSNSSEATKAEERSPLPPKSDLPTTSSSAVSRERISAVPSPPAEAAAQEEAAPVPAVELVDAMHAEWKVVWKILRSKGWTWAFGKAASSWHVMPGELLVPNI